MAGQTPRFGLNFYGGDTDGSLDEDNDKFTGEDRLLIDRLFASLETHSHRVTAGLDAPDDEPDLSYAAGDGDLDAGETYYYRVSFVNDDGLETVAGPEAAIELPSLLPTPDAPSAETTDDVGSLAPGTYYYAITGLRGSEETPLSDPFLVTVLPDESTVAVTLPDLDDATSYQVWRMRDTESGYTRIATTDTGSLVDDGSVPAGAYGDPANAPPTSNTGISTYAITVQLTGDDLTRVQTAQAWRLYRSTSSGSYGAASLVHEVVEHEDELDDTTPLMDHWIDDGDAALVGSPKLTATELHVAPYTFETNDTLPSPVGYPENYPLVSGGTLYVISSGAWVALSGGGGGTVRGVAIYTGHGAPTPEPADCLAGDLYLDLDTSDLYELDGA